MKPLALQFVIFVMANLCIVPVQAQYKKGDMLLNLGIGAANHSVNAVPGASFEYGFGRYISAGVQSDLFTYRTRDGIYTSLPTSIRASYHFGKHFLRIKTLDLYGGAALGYHSLDIEAYHPGKYHRYYFGNDDGLYLGLYAGAKYYFKPRFAVFSEVGHKVSWLKVGIAFRFY